LEVDSRNIVA